MPSDTVFVMKSNAIWQNFLLHLLDWPLQLLNSCRVLKKNNNAGDLNPLKYRILWLLHINSHCATKAILKKLGLKLLCIKASEHMPVLWSIRTHGAEILHSVIRAQAAEILHIEIRAEVAEILHPGIWGQTTEILHRGIRAQAAEILHPMIRAQAAEILDSEIRAHAAKILHPL